MACEDSPSAPDETAKILVDFLEVAITSILFHKGIYPAGAFGRRRYMNIVVQKALHPQLREYIHSAVGALLPFLLKGLVERVVIIFFDKDNYPLEKVIFKLDFNQSYGSEVQEADLEFAFRSFLLNLTVSDFLSRVLLQDCRWEIMANFHSLPQASTRKEAELWIPTETKEWLQPPLIAPIKSMNSESLILQLYVEHPSLSKPKS